MLYIPLILLLAVFSVVCAADSFQEQLDQAEALRTQAPGQTVEIVAQLESNYHALSAYQQQQFNFLKAYIYAFQSKQDEAISWATKIAASEYPEIRLKANLLLATVYEHRKDFSKAYSFLFTALKAGISLNNESLQVSLYTVATQLHISANVYDKALEYASNIVDIASTPRSYCVGYVLQLRATINLTQTYTDDAVSNARQACLTANEPLLLNTISLYIAEIDVTKVPAQVKSDMQSVLPELKKTGYLYSVIQAEFFLGSAELYLQNYAAAEALLEKVYQQTIALNDTQTANKAMLLLAQTYQEKGDTSAAVTAYRKHAAAQNSYIDEFKKRSVAYHLAQADFMASENKLALLKSENELLQLESKLQQEQKLKALLFAVALLALLLLVIYVLNSKRVALNRLATTDFLTRLFNRRYFSETVSKQMANRRQRGECSLLIFDIDLFKQINDKHGHAAGDKVLSAIAQCCQTQIRQQDILARIGGEEFALFLPGCGLADAEEIAEQCRQSLEQLVIPFDDQQIQITASFGVAASSTADFDSLLKQADDALYQAKTGGRNRIVVYKPADSSSSQGNKGV
ncbi:tetratricopeptide repeat-containing diguanylate cyclase [Arsukibacterium sp.]|uniref:tetratricopeptide repeat-containing diguanylate cyclase n=1 Tax=Arsukibacterium sp. TaxID=1977258 RepID=UPI00299D205E|nr:tetratricopeptide repeat-containing diguanylate cyclase [Arsukibacterium sp.]MDX1537173.1 tetratricopeptide repeat-containing diguanylate cyclase [Arsukibacterium sp.]